MKQLFTLCIALFSLTLVAQNRTQMEEFRRQQEERMKQFQSRQQAGMDSLRERQNHAFERMLQQEWEYRQLLKTPDAFENPKPPSPPCRTKDDKPPIDKTPPPEITIDPKKPPFPPPPKEAEDFGAGLNLIASTFFESAIYYPDVSKWPKVSKPFNQKAIASYWKNVTAEDHTEFLGYAAYLRENFQLNDWAYFQMLNKIAETSIKDVYQQEAFLWFVLVQSGFDVRLMFAEDELHLALPFDQTVYAKTYFVFDNERYYLLRPSKRTRLYTYSEQHENAQSILSMHKLTKVTVPDRQKFREFSFEHRGEKYKIELPFNAPSVRMYQTLPQLDLAYYFSEPADPRFDSEVQQILAPYLRKFPNMTEKVRFLHSMVTYSIPYQTDDEQFGYEKFCLPEEVLLYPYADCEDRTFLLNYFIRVTLGLETIGLHYPGHMTMAVRLPNQDEFEAIIEYDGKQYVYCDPTYFGADIGMMPAEYRGINPKVVR
ncbi:MAG: hypothetical protein JJU02_03530 [Cryomorphaceae bacterium]|nr:hypothetical protein [Cryomorphaceae bacterium]